MLAPATTIMHTNTSLPDELLKEILSAQLAIPDDQFFCGDAGSPFSAPREAELRCCSLLVVSKQWMRVATSSAFPIVLYIMLYAQVVA